MIVVVIILLLAIFILPNLWAKWVLARHSRGRDDYPGTGAELADHLLRRLGIEGVEVEVSEHGDHYDPQARRVRLSRENYAGRSLTAVTVAAHEVGHAIQHHEGYAPLAARSRMVGVAMRAEKLGALLMMAAPFLFILTRLPGGMAIVIVGGHQLRYGSRGASGHAAGGVRCQFQPCFAPAQGVCAALRHAGCAACANRLCL